MVRLFNDASLITHSFLPRFKNVIELEKINHEDIV